MRRRVFGQGSFEGGSLGVLHGALHCENVVAADRYEAKCQLAYAIGVAEPCP